MRFLRFLLVVVIYVIVDAIIRSKSRKITQAKTSEEAIAERKNLKHFLERNQTGMLADTNQTDTQETINKISDETIETFFANYPKKYALYLRAFHNDRYLSQDDPKPLFSMDDDPDLLKYGCFSEKHFVGEMEQFINTNAVGMTREVFSPDGAKRIYLNDDTWQQDVLLLMEKATIILVLIEYRENCLWEYQQSLSMREKTYYIIDDLHDYNDIKTKEGLLLPSIPRCFNKAKHLVFHWQEEKCYAQPYINTHNDYKYLSCFINGQETKQVQEEMVMGVYDGLGRLWISADDTDEDIRKCLRDRLQMKQRFCPLVFGEMALTDCDLVGNKVVFRFTSDEMDERLAAMSHDALSCELKMPENQTFLNVVEALRLQVCHVFYDAKGWQSEIFFILDDRSQPLPSS